MLARGYPFPAALEFAARCAAQAGRRSRLTARMPALASVINQPPKAEDGAVSVDAPRLANALSTLGIRRGDVLMVHSSGDAVRALGWDASDFIDFLLEFLGPDGTLAMPSHPKLAIEDGRHVYDVRRSPSRVGMLTELFRRRRGAIRSRYPHSSATAMGPHADALTGSHARSYAPHDEHSPYAKLAQLDGKVLCVGVSLDRMTILHVAEDVERDRFPISHFYVEDEITVRADGLETQVVAHSRAPWLWWYLCLSRWTVDMYRHGLARDHALHGVTLRGAEARRTVEWMTGDIHRGRTIYPLAGLNRWLQMGIPELGREA